MKRLITAGAAVILIGLSIGAAVAQPPIPYGPVRNLALRWFPRRDTDITGSRADGIGTAIATSGSAAVGSPADHTVGTGFPVIGSGMATATSGFRPTGADVRRDRSVSADRPPPGRDPTVAVERVPPGPAPRQ